MEVHVLNLARYFVQKGHTVEVVTSNSLNSARTEVYDGISIIRTPFFGKYILGWALSAVFSVPQFLRRTKYADIVHGHDIGAILPCVLAKAIYKRPLVLTLHSSHYIKLSKKAWFRPYLRLGIAHGDHVFAASEEIREIARRLVPHKNVEALVNPVDTELFAPGVTPRAKKKKDEFILVCPRRLVEKNGVHVLIEAMPMICASHDVLLLVAGDGPLRGRIERRMVELRIEERVSLLGSVTHQDMPGILSSADLIVIPSLMEATSIAALESMAAGKPIAASRVGGLPEIIDENVGYLMEPGNPESIATTVNRALDDPKSLKQKGALARRRVEDNWSARRLAEYHITVYEGLTRPSR